MFIIKIFNTNSMESEGSSVNEQTKSKIEYLKNVFSEVDRDLESEINKREIVDFLNSRTSDGKEFNQNLTKKILDTLTFNENGTISVEDFIKGLIYFESDLKGNQVNLQQKLYQEQKELEYNKAQCRKYQQEQLNSEGFCENAKITVTVEDVDMQTKLEDIKSIGITILYNDIVKKTNFVSGGESNVRLNENFEFKPKTRKDYFEFKLKGIDYNEQEIEIGSKVFNLEGTESQDLYHIDIGITDYADIDKIVASIHTIISFYWSDFDHYTKLVKKSEKKLEKLQKPNNQIMSYLQMLNSIYKTQNEFVEVTQQPTTNYNSNTNFNLDDNTEQQQPKLKGKRRQPSANTNPAESNNIMLSDKLVDTNEDAANPAISIVEQQLKSIFKQEKIHWIIYIKVLSMLICVLGVLCSFFRPDFPNTLGGIMVLLVCLFGFRNATKEKTLMLLKYLLNGVFGLLIYDLVWMVFYIGSAINGRDKYTGGNEDGILKFTMFITILNEIIKGCLSFGIWAQIKRTEQKTETAQ